MEIKLVLNVGWNPMNDKMDDRLIKSSSNSTISKTLKENNFWLLLFIKLQPFEANHFDLICALEQFINFKKAGSLIKPITDPSTLHNSIRITICNLQYANE